MRCSHEPQVSLKFACCLSNQRLDTFPFPCSALSIATGLACKALPLKGLADEKEGLGVVDEEPCELEAEE